MPKLNDEQSHEVIRLCVKLLPEVVRRTMKRLGQTYTQSGVSHGANDSDETKLDSELQYLEFPLERELFSTGMLMIAEQFPEKEDDLKKREKIENIIRKYLPDKLRDWYLDNIPTIVAVKAAANRKRTERLRKGQSTLEPEYAKQKCLPDVGVECPNNPGLDGLLSSGNYAPNKDYWYSVAEEDIDKVKQFYRFLYIFVADDDTDRAIIKYHESKFDPANKQIFLDLEKLSHQNIADAIGVSKATVSRRLEAMKKRIPKLTSAYSAEPAATSATSVATGPPTAT